MERTRSAPNLAPNTHRQADDVIRRDTIWPIKPASQLQHRKILRLIDVATRYTISIHLRSCSELTKLILAKFTKTTQIDQRTPDQFYSDITRGYQEYNIHQFLSINGIEKSFTPAYQHQSNLSPSGSTAPSLTLIDVPCATATSITRSGTAP